MTEEADNLTEDTTIPVNSTLKTDMEIEPEEGTENEVVPQNVTETSRKVNSTVTIDGIIVFDHSDGHKDNSICPKSSFSGVFLAFLVSQLLV